jgi:sulfur-oxidizing protein SoxA
LDASSGKVVNLSQRINICRERKQQAAPWKLESEELLSMEAYVAMQSRGMPVTPAQDAATKPPPHAASSNTSSASDN